jgi:hypothetical protein
VLASPPCLLVSTPYTLHLVLASPPCLVVSALPCQARPLGALHAVFHPALPRQFCIACRMHDALQSCATALHWQQLCTHICATPSHWQGLCTPHSCPVTRRHATQREARLPSPWSASKFACRVVQTKDRMWRAGVWVWGLMECVLVFVHVRCCVTEVWEAIKGVLPGHSRAPGFLRLSPCTAPLGA